MQQQFQQTRIVTETESHRYAGFWIRLLATMFDSIIIVTIGKIYLLLFPPLHNLYTSILVVVVYIIFLTNSGATPGMMILKIKIIDADTDKYPTFIQCIIRLLGEVVSTILLGVGYLMIAFDSKKRGLHDRIAGTVVVYRKK